MTKKSTNQETTNFRWPTGGRGKLTHRAAKRLANDLEVDMQALLELGLQSLRLQMQLDNDDRLMAVQLYGDESPIGVSRAMLLQLVEEFDLQDENELINIAVRGFANHLSETKMLRSSPGQHIG